MLPEREHDLYIAWRPEFPTPDFSPGDTALVVVDMQYRDAHPDGSLFRKIRAAGLADQLAYFEDRLKLIVPNIRSLQDAFRAAGMEVIHLRIQSMTRDGRDRGVSHKKLGHSSAPGSWEATILAELQPVGDELVFSKTAGSPFVSTNLAYVLRSMGIQNLVVTGVVTTGCVLTTVTDGADNGFHIALVEDGCAALVEEMHWAAIRIMRDVYAKIMTTEVVLQRIAELVPAVTTGATGGEG
jgi:nicotinamidase-related amidase